ncbi:MAG: dienelactone hydrolase family protein [Rhizobiaceae bacterium]
MIEGWQKTIYSTNAVDGKPLEHDIYTKGEGPVILLIQELPGIGPQMMVLADKIVAQGFTVVMPHLFGPIGKNSLGGNFGRVFCMRREFALFSKDASSPILNWLRALCKSLKDQYKVPGIGVIGMCMTGNFAISLMADDAVLASVSTQPSLPLQSAGSLHMSKSDVSEIRTALDEKGAMLAFRFAGDKICKPPKFEALDKAFNDDKERIKLRTLKGNDHSILTLHFMDEEGSPTVEALNEIFGYFKEKLNGAVATPRS